MRVLKTFRGSGELAFGLGIVPVDYELRIVYWPHKHAVEGHGTLQSKRHLGVAMMSGAVLDLLTATGETIKVVMTSLTGNIAQIATTSVVPGVDIRQL